MRNTLNASACAALLEDVNWSDPQLLLSLSVLAFINVMVIAGNCLVIAAVFCSSKLRSVTNLFIVSLAVADLLVGVAVLPFSATREVFQVWIFGNVWCNMWLALDVWMCTASILNLCAISLDRYVAVTRPITYPSIMSASRAKFLIVGIWILSFVICFPPLVGWKDAKSEDQVSTNGINDTTSLDEDPHCPWKCELTNEAGYVVYSALGSFYIPMFVMLFFYWRIYRTAVQTTRAINQGFKTTKGSCRIGNRFEEQRLTLRIHRGRSSSSRRPHGSPRSISSNSTTTTGSASPSPSAARGRHQLVKISVSYPSNENMAPNLMVITPTSPPPQPTYSVHYSVNGKDTNLRCSSDTHLKVHRLGSHRLQSSRRRSSSLDSTTSFERQSSSNPNSFEDGTNIEKPRFMSRRMGKRNIKVQVRRFRMETKAAKTLGIIVGGFIFCWLPFFTMYLVLAFCPKCVHPLVFSILFWLGYCNSAINPLIYALFSKDFRFAFKRIICNCFCNRQNEHGSRRGSDGSQLKIREFRSPSCNNQQHGNSLGEDSDPAGDPSESR